MDKKTIIQLLTIIVLSMVLVLSIVVTTREINNKTLGKMNPSKMMEEEKQKTTTASDVNAGETVKEDTIDLSKYNSNITIKEAGIYTVKGEFTHSLLVNSKEDVILVLNSVVIKNSVTAAIANIGEGNLTIKLAKGTTNTLADGGSSEYDACVYSVGSLIIEGEGSLNVYGNQEEGEGIATKTNNITINGGNIHIECADDGINTGGDGGIITINGGSIYIKASGDGIDSNKNLVINGGYVYTMGSSVGGDAGIDTDGAFEIHGGTSIALGSDMLQSPDSTSKQKSICFNLTNRISKGSNISLKNKISVEIVSFIAEEDFKTLIVSSEKVVTGTYYIYINGRKTNYSVTVE